MRAYRASLLSISLLFSMPVLALDTDAVIGGAVGGGLGAAVGSELGGREGAIAGSAVGAAVGTAIATEDEHEPSRYRESHVERDLRGGPPAHAYAPPPGHAKHQKNKKNKW